ncbi:MAG: hypothetical protein DRJ20_00665 [Candidatus Methanomethylicota archaeon]|mgnify:CR=1 FL=1|uniref:Uncharacterized protein n=1 Tax=Thermoproteota archaeon TaxID=2056631 RepID=A0A497EZN4_9CREN|nr:MAG: hypothetical protein DRJ20_00665 [Candidatus Verstraetearchaeota archaeon]
MARNKLVAAGMLISLWVMAALITMSIASSAQNIKEQRVERFLEVAEKAKDRVERLINIIYSNETVLEIIEDTGLIDEFNGNITLFNNGVDKLNIAHTLLEEGDLANAIGNATEAFKIFRDVYKSLHKILEEADLCKCEIIDAPGLIEAMYRALDRIERIREIASPEALEAIEGILSKAEEYLDIETAMELLSEGRVNETAHRLAEANRLIALAHSLLRKKAQELNIKRLTSYIKIVEKFCDRIERQINRLKREDLISKLDEAKALINDAKESLENGDYSSAILSIINARNLLREIEISLRGPKGPQGPHGGG